ncbi:hypothetical protein ACCO45_013525 [Purpureocillium lilacinum]|uniref:Uncharacterized protein n=1 Tax=Purpureocillium lilacinum TaxID=33203 RepID=A0ACC4D6W5_PURLI
MATTYEQLTSLLREWRELGDDGARSALQFSPPLDTDNSQDPNLWMHTSGIDCLVQLIRHIVSHAVDVPKCIGMLLREEPGNPILFHAFQTLHHHEPWPNSAQIAAATARKVALLEQVADKNQGPSAHTFDDLCNTTLMNETFWSRHEMQLLAKILVKDPATRRWHSKDLSRSEHGSLGIIPWFAKEHPTLQSAVDRAFGAQNDAEGNTEEVLLARCSDVARVAYWPFERHPVAFSELYQFDMPLTPYAHAERFMNETGHVPTHWRVHYRLFAVVRHALHRRGVPLGPDYIRTYNNAGSHVEMAHAPTIFVDKTWSIERYEPGIRYTLVYLSRAPLVPAPVSELNNGHGSSPMFHEALPPFSRSMCFPSPSQMFSPTPRAPADDRQVGQATMANVTQGQQGGQLNDFNLFADQAASTTDRLL